MSDKDNSQDTHKRPPVVLVDRVNKEVDRPAHKEFNESENKQPPAEKKPDRQP